MGLQGDDYKVDIVFVIDATGSMGPIMEQVKMQALSLGDKITSLLAENNRPVEQLRMRIIDFADFAYEGDDAIHQTDFFPMPGGRADFEKAVRDIEYERRGGDIPENALEALFIAMSSEWTPIARDEKGRHIIVLMTDALPLHLRERAGLAGYVAEDYPADVAALQAIWDANDQDATTDLSPRNKRLILFVPEGTDAAGHSWDNRIIS